VSGILENELDEIKEYNPKDKKAINLSKPKIIPNQFNKLKTTNQN